MEFLKKQVVTLMDMTRCFLSETGLPKRLWGEQASTAVFLKNRIPHSTLGSDTPYYRMFGKNADLSFFASHRITSICARGRPS